MSKKVISFYDSEKQSHDFPIITPDYGTCSTASNTSAKVVTCDDFSLFTGAEITVKFTNVPTTDTITLNVNNSGAKNVDFSACGNKPYDEIKANGCYGFVYDGTSWIYKGSGKGASKEELERLEYYDNKDIIPSDSSYFTVNGTGDTITGLTDAGKTQTELVIPYEINGKKITTLYSGVDSGEPRSILNGSSTITKITIPKSVTTLGRGVFFSCLSLTSINIPNSVTSISESAFENCTSLTSINIPNSVTSISENAFMSCSSLTSINIPNSVTSISESAFENCTSLTSINIPNSVTSISENVFAYCLSLTSINIPNSVTSIGSYAFESCTNLTIYCEQGSYAETYAKSKNIPIMYTDISATDFNNKADKATTISGYGITDAYTKTEVDTKLSTVYKVKGSVNDYSIFEMVTNHEVGDVYNLQGVYTTSYKTTVDKNAFQYTYNSGTSKQYLVANEISAAYQWLNNAKIKIHTGTDTKTGVLIETTYVPGWELTLDDGTLLTSDVYNTVTSIDLTVYHDFKVGDNVVYIKGGFWDKLAATVDLSGYQEKLTFDDIPTADSTNPVTSGGVKTTLDGKLDKTDADAKYALISDLNNIVTEMENSIIQGGNIDSLTLDIPFTDTSRINKIYNVVRGNWNGVREEAGGYHRFNYNCTMTNAKIINDNGSYYIQCNASDIPTELYSRPFGNFTLNDELSTFDIAIGSYIYTFEYTSYSGNLPSEVLKFSLKNVQYGPDFSDDYYAQKFVDNIYNLGDIATVWAVDINVGDNFVITKNGFDSLVGNYATSGELNDLQRKLDTINKTLSGVYKNGGDVTEMTLDIPVSSNKINTMYNVKSGFDPNSNYGEHSAFKYKITIKNAYILKTTSDSGNIYELCFKLGDIPSELWYSSIGGMITFYGKFQNTIDYQPTDISGCFEFTSPSELSIQLSPEWSEYIVKLPYEVSYNAPTIDDYFSDKTFTDNKYQLGNITTIWYRNDISVDDNFVITEYGYDVLSYKITDYVSKSSFDNLSVTVAKKANSSDVYTKDEIDDTVDDIKKKAFISETVSGYPVVIPKDEMLAGEQYTDFRIYGNTDGFGALSSSTNKYTINLTCRGKNLIYRINANSQSGITRTINDDGSVTLSGTANNNYTARCLVSYLPPGTYHLSGCPQGGSEDTYYIKIGTLGVDTGDGVTFTLDTVESVMPIIYVKKGTVLDNVIFKPQIEIGEVATGFEKYGQTSAITITLDTALGENEYVDIINKKRYNGDSTVSNVTVSGEMSVFDSDMTVIYCPMATSPSKIEMSYYKDINKVIDTTNNATNVSTVTSCTGDELSAITSPAMGSIRYVSAVGTGNNTSITPGLYFYLGSWKKVALEDTAIVSNEFVSGGDSTSLK